MKKLSSYEIADLLQLVVARHYELQWGASVVSIGDAPKWDVRFANDKTMEIKLDASASSTWNAAIEFWDTRRNTPTGILSSKATIWLHCVPDGEGLRCFEIETVKILKAIIEDGKVVQGGDYNSSLMKLLPLQKLKEIATCEFYLEHELIKLFKYW